MLQLKHISEPSPELDTIIQLFRDYANELNEDLCFQSFGAELENPLKKYGLPLGDLILAYYNNQPVGCIALADITNEKSSHQQDNENLFIEADVKVCEMKRLYVHPEYRKYGIGKALVVEILKSAKKLNYGMMKLDTLEKLQPAIELYKKYGFEITNAYYQNPLPKVVYMQLKLK